MVSPCFENVCSKVSIAVCIVQPNKQDSESFSSI